MSIKYKVTIEVFAKFHYLKKISKKYKKSFDVPWRAFELMLSRFDLMLKRKNTNEVALINDNVSIYKTEFKIMPQESTKSSGNRCIVARNFEKQTIRILLVYRKGDVQGGNETAWWKNLIRENYKRYKDCL